MSTLPESRYPSLQDEYDAAKRRYKAWGASKKREIEILAGYARKYAKILFGDGDIDDKARLPDGMRSIAMAELNVKSPHSVENRATRCRMFERAFRDDPDAYIYSMVKLSGQPKIELTELQQAIVVGAYLFNDWEAVLPDKQTKRTRERVQFKFIYNMFCQLFPDAQHRNRPITQETIERCIAEQREERPALFKLGREGGREIWEKWMPKQPSDVRAPNECWIIDARTLPFYIRHKKKKCTVTLLVIIDAYSGYIVAWHVVVRAVTDGSGETRKADFTADDVRLLVLYAIIVHGVRPKIIYTDNGSQFKAPEPLLPLLSHGQSDEIVMVFGFPGHPWSRGKVEVTLREFDKALLKYAGVVRDEKDRESWRRARKSANFTIDNLQSVAGAHVKRWCEEAKDEGRTRRDRFENDLPLQLPIPSFDRLLYFGCGYRYGEARTTRDDARINGNGIYIPLRGWHKPAQLDNYSTWLNAAGRGRVPYTIIPLPDEEWIFACLDGKRWERLIAKDDQLLSRESHVENQWAAIRAERDDLTALRHKFIEALAQLGQRVPQIADDDSAVLQAIVTAEDAAGTASQESVDSQPPRRTNGTSNNGQSGRRRALRTTRSAAGSLAASRENIAELDRLTALFQTFEQQKQQD